MQLERIILFALRGQSYHLSTYPASDAGARQACAVVAARLTSATASGKPRNNQQPDQTDYPARASWR